MIFGNGIDIQEISVIKKIVIRQPKFITKILTSDEKKIFDSKSGKHKIEFLAGRYAAKEAYSKALGTGIGSDLSWSELEILNNDQGKPYFKHHPRLNDLIVHLSISHSGNMVKTEVILEDFPNNELPVSIRRSSWIEISKNAVAHNINLVREISRAKNVIAIIKANAYGHGLPQMIEAAKFSGVDAFGVATLDEAIWLRHFGVKNPILVLGVVDPEYVFLALQEKIIIPVVSLNWIKSVQTIFLSECVEQSLLVSLAIDTGMTRIGVRSSYELNQILSIINADCHFKLHSIWTHFATADTDNEDYFKKQLECWNRLTNNLNLSSDIWRHLANSGTTLWHDNPSIDAIRVGAAMYGIDSSQKKLKHRDLQPVLSLKAKLVQVKQVEANVSISYGATYTTIKPTWIGTLPLGYADGYLRKLQNGYGLLPDGRRVKIVGRITMDQLMVSLPEKIKVGTVITLIGSVGDESITLEDLAERLETIPYEVATGFSTRLPRYLVD